MFKRHHFAFIFLLVLTFKYLASPGLVRSEVSCKCLRSRNYPCGGIHFKET